MERKGICKNVGVCSMVNKVQIITDDDAPFVCPECGEELQPYKEEIPEPSNKSKKPIIIGVVGILILAIIGCVIALTGGESETPSEKGFARKDSIKAEKDTVTVTNTETRVDTVKIEKTIETETTPTSQKTTTTTTTTSKSTGSASSTVHLSYGKYTGETKGGFPHGQGRLTYTKSRQINKNDVKARMANVGDYVIGEFFNGFVVYGKHYDANGNLLESLNIGVGSEDSYESK